jgi:hypothetical protein
VGEIISPTPTERQHIMAKHSAMRLSSTRNYVIEYFNHPASKGGTVFSGTKYSAIKFLEYESNTFMTPKMQQRADEFMWYLKSLTPTDMNECDGFYWPLEADDEGNNGSGAYYYLSLHHGKRAKRFADA